MVNGTTATCIDGLELALKWAGLRADAEVAQCTAAIASACTHRDTCPTRTECTDRLRALEAMVGRGPIGFLA